MNNRSLILLALLLAMFVSSCCSTCCGSGCCDPGASAQQIVDETVKRHDDIVRLTIHATPSGESSARVVATNSEQKRGKLSDPEDLKTFATGEAIVLQEGQNVDVTLPVRDASGAIIAVTGVTLSNPKGKPEAEVVASARKIAAEVEAAVRAAKAPLW